MPSLQPPPRVPLCGVQGVPVGRGLLVHVSAGPLHRPDGVDEGGVGAGVAVLIGLAGIRRGDHGAGLGGMLLKAEVGHPVGGVAL